MAMGGLTELRTANWIRLVEIFGIALKAGLAVTVVVVYLRVRSRRPAEYRNAAPHVVPLAISHLICLQIVASDLYLRYQWSQPLSWLAVKAALIVGLGAFGLVTLLRKLLRESWCLRDKLPDDDCDEPDGPERKIDRPPQPPMDLHLPPPRP